VEIMMRPTTIETLCAVSTAIVVVVAIITDLRSRRIPNILTFTAFGIAVAVRLIFQGWLGLGIALSGAVAAPGVLLLLHMGRGLGMGDVKLAMAVGAFLGPTMAVISMLAAAIVGGVIAIGLLMRRGQMMSEFLSLCLIGLPFVKARKQHSEPADNTPASAAPAVLTMPYGVAIGIGSLATLVVYTWL
jgi:prepilin peptidase CpaA